MSHYMALISATQKSQEVHAPFRHLLSGWWGGGGEVQSLLPASEQTKRNLSIAEETNYSPWLGNSHQDSLQLNNSCAHLPFSPPQVKIEI